MKYEEELFISKKDAEKYNTLLALENKDNLPISLGYDIDKTIKYWTAKFANGYEADIKVCSAYDSFFIDPVLFDQDGFERMCLQDWAETIEGEYEWESGGDTYVVKMIIS